MFKLPMRIISMFSLLAVDNVLLNIFAKLSVRCNDESGGLYAVHKGIFLDFLIQISIQIDSISVNSKSFPRTKSCLSEI